MPQIKPITLYVIAILSSGAMDHVIVLPLLIGSAGRDAWLSILLAAMASVIWLLLLYYVLRHVQGERLFDWLRSRYGSPTAWTVLLILSLQLLFVIYVTLMDTINWAEITFLPQTPYFVIALLFLALCFSAANTGILPIALSAFILFPVVIVLGHFVGIAKWKYKDYALLAPMLENGLTPVLKGMLYAAAGISEFTALPD